MFLNPNQSTFFSRNRGSEHTQTWIVRLERSVFKGNIRVSRQKKRAVEIIMDLLAHEVQGSLNIWVAWSHWNHRQPGLAHTLGFFFLGVAFVTFFIFSFCF
jgi:hypothetical protein